jgi:hypothetical protein
MRKSQPAARAPLASLQAFPCAFARTPGRARAAPRRRRPTLARRPARPSALARPSCGDPHLSGRRCAVEDVLRDFEEADDVVVAPTSRTTSSLPRGAERPRHRGPSKKTASRGPLRGPSAEGPCKGLETVCRGPFQRQRPASEAAAPGPLPGRRYARGEEARPVRRPRPRCSKQRRLGRHRGGRRGRGPRPRDRGRGLRGTRPPIAAPGPRPPALAEKRTRQRDKSEGLDSGPRPRASSTGLDC